MSKGTEQLLLLHWGRVHSLSWYGAGAGSVLSRRGSRTRAKLTQEGGAVSALEQTSFLLSSNAASSLFSPHSPGLLK